MSCVNGEASKKAGRAFRVLTALFVMLMLAVLLLGLLHKSDQPQIFGRYSTAYGLLLLGVLAVTVCLCWVFLAGGTRTKRWIANLYALLISTFFVIVMVELGLRVFNPFGVDFFHNLPYHMQGMVDDPQLGYRHPKSVTYMLGANQVMINSHGLRDDEVPYIPSDDEQRILVLGDSVTFGWGVSQGETFSDRMEGLLRTETGRQWQVINAGVNGYNTEQEAAFLRIEGMRYSPDYVLLVYVSNDVDPVLDPNETTWRRYPTWTSSLPEAINRLRQLSYLFQLTKLFTRLERMDQARAAATADSGAQSADHTPSITENPGWQRSEAALLDIARQCKEAGIPFLVGLFSPSELVDVLRKTGIDTIPLRPAYKDIPESLAHVSRIDPHPSALVHEEMAKYLVNIFGQRGWLNHKK
jgi:lysophospholipase L1-like esterase